jgi:hypothetical protein
MDKEEARIILDRQIMAYREKTFQQLAALVGSAEIYTMTGSSGVEYQIEVQAFWDRPKKPGENLRVILSIDDGGFLSSLKPMSSDFIMAPDGSFIGE